LIFFSLNIHCSKLSFGAINQISLILCTCQFFLAIDIQLLSALRKMFKPWLNFKSNHKQSFRPSEPFWQISLEVALEKKQAFISDKFNAQGFAINQLEIDLETDENAFELLESFWKENIKDTDSVLVGFIGYDFAGFLEPKVQDFRQTIFPFPTLQFTAYRHFTFANKNSVDIAQNGSIGVETQKKIIENFEDLIIDSEYKLIIEQALAHIEKGDLYEINLSRPSLIELSSEISMCELAHIFEAKAKEPYSACLPLDAKRMILSNSPECFLRKSGNKVSTFPIKGTRRRYEDSNKDNASIEELMRSPKEMAEHLMVVDLERNDLGKVAQAGSVTVESFAELNTFSNVHHLISEVSCELKDNINPFDLLRATFPSGSVTGAPKIRVMQIIRSLEKYSRSAYTGALGYIDGKGDLEFSILIRSLMVNGNQALLNTGGGIVYDSNPDFEIEETHLKAQSILNLFE